MAARKTKNQKIAEKVEQGMSRLEAEIAVLQEETDARVKALQKQQAKHTETVRLRVAELLEEQDPTTYRHLVDQVEAEIEADRRKRSERARAGLTAGDDEQELPEI